MPDRTLSRQFWVLTGDIPAGPYTLDQLHQRLASGEISWQTPASPVGGGRWLPLLKTPGVGPDADSPAPDIRETDPAAEKPVRPVPPGNTEGITSIPGPPEHSPPAGASSPARMTSAARATAGGVGLLALILAGLGLVGYWLYDWLRPSTATEVCELMEKATTAEEAKRYCTTRMHRMLHELYADPTNLNPNDHFVFTRETDGPKPGTKLVGFRGSVYFPAEGGRFQMEGHLVLIDSGGWKVDDMVVSGVEGVSLPGPVSMVDEYVKGNPPSGKGGLSRPAGTWGERQGEWAKKNWPTLLLTAGVCLLWVWGTPGEKRRSRESPKGGISPPPHGSTTHFRGRPAVSGGVGRLRKSPPASSRRSSRGAGSAPVRVGTGARVRPFVRERTSPRDHRGAGRRREGVSARLAPGGRPPRSPASVGESATVSAAGGTLSG